jgi:hypothetical protein
LHYVDHRAFPDQATSYRQLLELVDRVV